MHVSFGLSLLGLHGRLVSIELVDLLFEHSSAIVQLSLLLGVNLSQVVELAVQLKIGHR